MLEFLKMHYKDYIFNVPLVTQKSIKSCVATLSRITITFDELERYNYYIKA